MMSENNSRLNSRLNRPNRKKKSNRLLNILIGIVLLLIIVVVVNIVTDKSPDTTKEEDKTSITDEKSDEENSETDIDSDADIASVPADQNEAQDETEEEKDEEAQDQTTSVDKTTENDKNEIVTTEPSEDTNMEEVTVDTTWEPIGTTQIGEHTSSYDSKSLDWEEKVQALSYGAGLDPSNMYVKFLGNGGSPQKSIGTVTSKDGTQIYRISLEWIDGQGWKPTKKEKLTSLEDAS